MDFTDKNFSAGKVDAVTSFADDPELFDRLRMTFLETNRTKFAEISEAIKAKDITLALRLTHTLKGNAGFIGKTVLRNKAAFIESCLKAGTIPDDQSLESLNNELDLVLHELSFICEYPDFQPDQKKLCRIQVRSLLDHLEPLLYSCNTACLNQLEDIRTIQGSEKLVSLIEDYDFSSAVAALAELRDLHSQTS